MGGGALMGSDERNELPATGGREARALRLAALLSGGALLLFASATVRAGLEKYYSIDEFMHAHAAWIVGRGGVPYRDFCDFHFPLLYQLLGVLWTLLPDDPGEILLLRVAILPLVALAALAAAAANRRKGKVAVLLAPAFLLSIVPYVVRATEIRHDTLAFALFLSSVVLLLPDRPVTRARGAAAGALLVLAVWGSQKILLYGSVFGAFVLFDLLGGLRPGRPTALGSRGAFLAGVGAMLAAIAAYLTVTGSWGACFTYAIRWALRWQADYPPFSWRRSFAPLADGWAWLFVPAALGIVVTLHGLARRGREGWRDVDVALLGTLVASFLYYRSLSAPYEYNLIPFFGLLAVFAARGAAALLDAGVRLAAEHGVAPLAPVLVLFAALVLPLALSWRSLGVEASKTNGFQHAVLSQIADLTSPSDAAYDNSGSYVARPSASFYFYTDVPMRSRLKDVLVREIPKSILENGAVLLVRDARFDSLPEALRSFLVSHYQPFSGDLWLWGRKFQIGGGGAGDAMFQAVKSGRYFVEPEEAVRTLRIRIDGVAVTEPVVELSRGPRRVEWDASAGAEFAILWLPRDGRTWTPRPGEPPRFSRIL